MNVYFDLSLVYLYKSKVNKNIMELVRGLPGYAKERGYEFYEKGSFALVPLCPGKLAVEVSL
jgi:hypothetical protein